MPAPHRQALPPAPRRRQRPAPSRTRAPRTVACIRPARHRAPSWGRAGARTPSCFGPAGTATHGGCRARAGARCRAFAALPAGSLRAIPRARLRACSNGVWGWARPSAGRGAAAAPGRHRCAARTSSTTTPTTIAISTIQVTSLATLPPPNENAGLGRWSASQPSPIHRCEPGARAPDCRSECLDTDRITRGPAGLAASCGLGRCGPRRLPAPDASAAESEPTILRRRPGCRCRRGAGAGRSTEAR